MYTPLRAAAGVCPCVNVQKSPIYTCAPVHTIDQKSPIHIEKSPVYTLKRALHILKRALWILKKALYTLCFTRPPVCVPVYTFKRDRYILKRDLYYSTKTFITQKRPTYIQKSLTHTRKRPVNTQKSPTWLKRDLHYSLTYMTQKRPILRDRLLHKRHDSFRWERGGRCDIVGDVVSYDIVGDMVSHCAIWCLSSDKVMSL